jgi:hypothetical protein
MNPSQHWNVARLLGAGLLLAGICAAQGVGQPDTPKDTKGPAAKDKASKDKSVKDKSTSKDKAPLVKNKFTPKNKAPVPKDRFAPGAGKGVFKAQMVKPPVSAKLNHDHVKVKQRPAVAHKAFKVADPKTGKEVKHDTMLTLPGGKIVQAGEYYAELNKLEKQLNTIGHSLRGKAANTVLVETGVDLAKHKKAVATLSTRLVKFNPKTMRAAGTRKDLAAQYAKAKATDKQRAAALAKAAPKMAGATKTSRSVKNWNYLLGKKNVVAGFLDGKLELKGSKDAVDILAEAGAGGYLANRRVNVLSARGSVRVPQAGQSTARLNVYVMGNSIYNKNLSAATSQTWSDQLTKTFDYSTTFRFALGPIPCSVKLGAQGTVGVRYFIGVRPAHATAQFIPKAQVRAYAQFAVDIIIASAGVGGQLHLVDFELRLGGDLEIGFENSRGAFVAERFYGAIDLHMLGGKLYVYAEVTVPAFDIPPWHKKRYQWDLWKWAGLTKKGYLFNVSNKTYL